MEKALMESLIASLPIIHLCLIPRPALRFMLMGSGICGAVRLTEGTLSRKREEGGYSAGMSGRTDLKKSTSLLKEGTMAGERRRASNATTQSFATIPLWVRKKFLTEDYFTIRVCLQDYSSIFPVELNNLVLCVKWRLFTT